MIEFYVGNYRIDMARSQIIAKDDILSMEPKVLQVLLILAENQGQVVPHNVILEKVWPDTIVGPNAIQRCIAQLRKAFNDDAKAQRVITTHPKVGYSLVADVNWQQELINPETNLNLAGNTTSTTTITANKNRHTFMVAVVVTLAIVISYFSYQSKTKTKRLPLSKLTALTATKLYK